MTSSVLRASQTSAEKDERIVFPLFLSFLCSADECEEAKVPSSGIWHGGTEQAPGYVIYSEASASCPCLY